MSASVRLFPSTDRRSRRAQRRIVFVANSLAVGGAERQLVHAATGLAARGHDVRVATMLDWPGLQPVLHEAGVPVSVLPVRRPARAVTALATGAWLLRQHAPDVVISFDFQANVLGRLAGRAARVPLVISSIRSERFGGTARERLIRATDRLADVTTTNSRVVADDLVARGLVGVDRVAVVPNAIDVAAAARPISTRLRVRRELEATATDVLFLAVGHLAPRKDHGTLLAAVARARHRDRIRVIVAGDGDLDELRRDAAACGVADRIDVLGWRDDVADLLAGADALVSSSVWEGLPNAVMEALAAGVPVVATRAGGTAELVTDGVSGHLVPVRDVDRLAVAMDRLVETPRAVRLRMGLAGRAHVTAVHDPERVTDRWEALLVRSRALAGSRP